MKATDGLNGPFENLEDPEGFSASSLEPNKIYRILDTYSVHTEQGAKYVVQRPKKEVTRYFQTHSRT